MLFKPTITLFLATLAAAATTKRQSQPNLKVTLANDESLGFSEVFNVSADGTGVVVDSPAAWGFAELECLENCIPQFHCILHDKDLRPQITLRPGRTGIAGPINVGLIVCGPGLPDGAA